MRHLGGNNIKELFTYTKQEIRGIVVLLMLIFFVIILPDLYSMYSVGGFVSASFEMVDPSDVGIMSDVNHECGLNADSLLAKELVTAQAINLKASQDSGLNVNKVDLIGENASLNNEKTVLLGKRIKKTPKIPPRGYHKSKIIIEINSSDTTELKKVYGLGSWYSRKIVRYRDRLGGFFSVSQLKEIKMHDGTYERISPQLSVDTSLVRRIDLDSIGFKNLLRHPYFDYPMVKKVFQLRRKDKNITCKDLLDEGIVSREQYIRIRKYCIE